MTVEVQWSELQRDPKGVAALADEGDVRVRRRDGAALLLIREDRVRSGSAGAVTAARALRNLFTHLSPRDRDEVLRDEFPWIDLLPEEDRAVFIGDFVHVFRASAELGDWQSLDQLVTEWKATAIVHSDRALAGLLAEPVVDDLGPVPNPDEAA
jgi:hypothetical protein